MHLTAQPGQNARSSDDFHFRQQARAFVDMDDELTAITCVVADDGNALTPLVVLKPDCLALCFTTGTVPDHTKLADLAEIWPRILWTIERLHGPAFAFDPAPTAERLARREGSQTRHEPLPFLWRKFARFEIHAVDQRASRSSVRLKAL